MDSIGLPININLIIHPKWPIDEYAIIARNCLWFIPIIPPSSAFNLAIREMIDCDIWLVKNTKTDRGASFCHDDKIVHDIHEIDAITEGYQKWQGALPSFRRTDIINILDIIEGITEYGVHNIIDDVNIIADPRAWARKYLILPSISWFDLDEVKIGINLKRFNSMAAHKNIQFVLEIAIIVLVVSVVKVNIVAGDHINLIRLWRSWTPL